MGAARRGRSGQRAGGAARARRPLAAACRFCYELRLHRARGYGALKAILDVLAEEEPLTLTEIALRLHRTPGSTKDYLSWLEDVDLIMSRQKRYSFTDPLLRLWVRLHCRADAARQTRTSRAKSTATCWRRLPHTEPALALAGAPPRRGRREELGNHRDRLRMARAAFAAACAASFLLRPSARATGSPFDHHLDLELPPVSRADLGGQPVRRAVRDRVTAAIPAAPTCSPR